MVPEVGGSIPLVHPRCGRVDGFMTRGSHQVRKLLREGVDGPRDPDYPSGLRSERVQAKAPRCVLLEVVFPTCRSCGAKNTPVEPPS